MPIELKEEHKHKPVSKQEPKQANPFQQQKDLVIENLKDVAKVIAVGMGLLV